ncbi:MAG: 2-oxoacid:acceptor oxidoreductase family protein, partial [Pseudomonadota bacterium]
MYRIRFHGRGGQGVKTAARILGSAFFNEGFEVQDAPVYGAERRGAPMYATVRAARAPIYERGLITQPDLVVVADETLMPVPAANVLLGVSARTVLLINSAIAPEEWQARLSLAGPIVTLPVSSEVESRAELPFVGAMCAGVAARLVGCISEQSLSGAIRTELQGLGDNVIESNLTHARAAYTAVAAHAGVVAEGAAITARDYAHPAWIDLPFEAARIAAPDIFAAATSVQIKTGAWRTMRPVIDEARCNRCTWVCSTMCPDSAIRVEDGRPVIDYDHCKGCLICAAVCPPHAISAEPERAGAAA